MNELKPEDVMKALECCIKTQCENCCQLGTWHEQWNCMTDLMKKALALLREKDAEIKELTDDNKWSAKRIIETDKLVSLLKAEVERLNKERDDARRDCTVAEQNHYECKKELETARADSITDFVDGCVKMAIGLGGIPVVCLESIFQFAKKMKEEKDGESDL